MSSWDILEYVFLFWEVCVQYHVPKIRVMLKLRAKQLLRQPTQGFFCFFKAWASYILVSEVLLKILAKHSTVRTEEQQTYPLSVRTVFWLKDSAVWGRTPNTELLKVTRGKKTSETFFTHHIEGSLHSYEQWLFFKNCKPKEIYNNNEHEQQ